jgi:predicted lipoprotein with Yx(FWY)xxD motif
MRRLSTLAPIALAAGLALGAAACGSSSSTTETKTTTPATAEASGSSSSTAAASGTPAGTTELKTASSSLGDIVVDGEGRTLYVFTADSGTTTACTGGCATAWPALVAPAKAGSGVTGAVTEATQSGGVKQVALNGHLLYYYAADAAPGATSGQGVGGKWFVVDGAGNPITKAPSGSSSGY